MIIEVFQPWHIDMLAAQGVQGAQLRQVSHVPASYANVTRPPGPAVTARDGERMVLCGGMVQAGNQLGLVWAVLAADAGRHLLGLHRAVERFLEMHHCRRIEATVEEGFPAGCRWLELLGFEYEGAMPGYGTDGETHLRFGRVRTC